MSTNTVNKKQVKLSHDDGFLTVARLAAQTGDKIRQITHALIRYGYPVSASGDTVILRTIAERYLRERGMITTNLLTSEPNGPTSIAPKTENQSLPPTNLPLSLSLRKLSFVISAPHEEILIAARRYIEDSADTTVDTLVSTSVAFAVAVDLGYYPPTVHARPILTRVSKSPNEAMPERPRGWSLLAPIREWARVLNVSWQIAVAAVTQMSRRPIYAVDTLTWQGALALREFLGTYLPHGTHAHLDIAIPTTGLLVRELAEAMNVDPSVVLDDAIDLGYDVRFGGATHLPRDIACQIASRHGFDPRQPEGDAFYSSSETRADSQRVAASIALDTTQLVAETLALHGIASPPVGEELYQAADGLVRKLCEQLRPKGLSSDPAPEPSDAISYPNVRRAVELLDRLGQPNYKADFEQGTVLDVNTLFTKLFDVLAATGPSPAAAPELPESSTLAEMSGKVYTVNNPSRVAAVLPKSISVRDLALRTGQTISTILSSIRTKIGARLTPSSIIDDNLIATVLTHLHAALHWDSGQAIGSLLPPPPVSVAFPKILTIKQLADQLGLVPEPVCDALAAIYPNPFNHHTRIQADVACLIADRLGFSTIRDDSPVETIDVLPVPTIGGHSVDEMTDYLTAQLRDRFHSGDLHAALMKIAAQDTAVAKRAKMDDDAVDAFAQALKDKLAEARAKGRSGWDDKQACPTQRLSNMLRDHIDKGDPRDVANFCMFLWHRKAAIQPDDRIPLQHVLDVEIGHNGTVTYRPIIDLGFGPWANRNPGTKTISLYIPTHLVYPAQDRG